MKTKFKLTLALVCLAVLALCFVACGSKNPPASTTTTNPYGPLSQGLNYTLSEDGTYYIVSGIGTCTDTDIVIPSTYEGKPVKEIGESAFADCSSLTSVTLGRGVTSIGDEAFANCYSLTSVTIPDSVTSIGEEAFCTCVNLTSITIPDNVTNIGDWAFDECYKLVEVINHSDLPIEKGSEEYGCIGLNALYVHKGESKIKNVNDYLFITDENGTHYLVGYLGTDKDLTLPSDYNGENYGLYSCAFAFCTSLTSVDIPDSVTSIGELSFFNCSALTSVTIPNSVTSIGDRTFYNCSSLEEIYFNATAMNDLSENNDVFGGAGENGNGIKVVIGANVTKIPAYLFCKDLFDSSSPTIKIKSLVFEEGSVCASIGERAFSGCDSLTSVDIPDSVTSIGDHAFAFCFALNAVYITDLAAWCKIFFFDYGANPLLYAGNLYLNGTLVTELVIPNSVTSIGDYAFHGCKVLTYVEMESVKSIGKSAFSDCYSLNSVVIPDSVTSIGDHAFHDCSALTSVTIPDSMTSIGSDAFAYCSALQSIMVGENNTTYKSIDGNLYTKDGKTLIQYAIGKTATSFTIPDGVTSIGDYAFAGCSSLTSVVIPDRVTGIGSYAFYNCDGLTSVTIGSGVTSIGDSAFAYCSSLEEIYFNVTAMNDLSENNDVFVGAGVNGNGIKVVIGANVTKIPAYLFDNCDGVKSLVFEKGSVCASIGECAFFGCKALTSVTVSDSVTSIDDRAFSNCSSLTSVTLGRGVTSIGKSAFASCFGLYSVAIPDSVTSIGIYAFVGCINLGSVTIGNGVTSIGDSAFHDCYALTSVTIGNGVTSIGEYAFSGCDSLTSVTFENTEGWKAGDTILSSTDLADTATAAEYLRRTYRSYSWTRS